MAANGTEGLIWKYTEVIFASPLLTGLPGSGRWRRQYLPSYLGECLNDATAGESKS